MNKMLFASTRHACLRAAALIILCAASQNAPAQKENTETAVKTRRQARVDGFFNRSCTRTDLGSNVALARNGTLNAHIVIRPDASPVVRFAADELIRYISRMTGAKPVVHDAPAAGTAIILGDSPEARSAGIDVNALARDGYRIRITPRQILIAGRDEPGPKAQILFDAYGKNSNDATLANDMAWDFERGTLNGVYRFLEECGCRWFMPGPNGEIVPETPDLSLKSADIAEEPAFALRVFGRTTWRAPAERHVPVQDLVKPEIAAVGMNAVANRFWLVRVRASSEWFAFNHRPPRTFWEQRFGETHPEYFAILPDGKRDLSDASGRRHTGHLCYSQEGVFTETVKDVDAYFSGRTAQSRGIPERYTVNLEANNGWRPNACYGDTVSLLPHDGFRGCHCAQCLAKTDADGPPWQVHSNLVWPFVARVAGQIEALHPDKLIICLAYSSYSVVPDGLDLPDNVIVGVCPRTLNKIYNIVDEAPHAELLKLIDGLSTANNMPLLYWFHHLYRLGMRQATYYGVPMLLPHFFGRFIPELARHGRLFFCEMDHDSIMFEQLNRYVVMRLLFDPTTDVDALLDDYTTAFYGKGAPYIRPILRDIETCSEKIAATGARPDTIWKTIYTAEKLAQYRNAVQQAQTATAGTPRSPQVELFGDYVVGLMEKGRKRFMSRFADPEKLKAATILAPRAEQPVVVDGILDDAAWKEAKPYPLLNNIDASPLQWPSTARVALSENSIACAFSCADPRLKNPTDMPPTSDYIEIFLEPAGSTGSYYQILVYPDGRILDFNCSSRTRDADKDWLSHARSAVAVRDGAWCMEVSIPLDSLLPPDTDAAGTTWRTNLCRTIMDPPRPNDQFSSTSPFMRGAFRQPHLFVPLSFK